MSTTTAGAGPCSSGPLRGLADRAARSPLVRRAQTQMPAFASGVFSRTASSAGGLLERVDGQLDKMGRRVGQEMRTKEGEEVCKSAGDMCVAVWGFVVAVCSMIIGMAERCLHVHNVSTHGFAPRLRALGERIGENMHDRHAWEKELWKLVSAAAHVAAALVACVVDALKGYQGPAKHTVRAVAAEVDSVLHGPDNALRGGAATHNAHRGDAATDEADRGGDGKEEGEEEGDGTQRM